jgi:lipopolysaccharide cholinephosphotransferase
MQYIDKFCEEYHIQYCLMGGSALGAVRHGGFIPWDDDLDVFMTPDNYEKFRNCFRQNGDHSIYYLQEWGASNGMISTAKIRMNNTTYIEDLIQSWDIHHGIYVDIFILHICPDNTIRRWVQYFWAKYVIIKGLANKKYNRKKGLLGIIIKLMGLFPRKFLLMYALKQVYLYRNKETKYYCNFLGKARMRNGMYKKEYFINFKKTPFEKTKLYVPEKIELFLEDRFGDYMRIPSPEQIKHEQHASSWSIGEGLFNESVKCYSDEQLLI